MPLSSKEPGMSILSGAAVRGFSFLEKPQLVFGDKTLLQPGMVLVVDGSISMGNIFRAHVGESFIVTEEGYEPLTGFAKDLTDIVIS